MANKPVSPPTSLPEGNGSPDGEATVHLADDSISSEGTSRAPERTRRKTVGSQRKTTPPTEPAHTEHRDEGTAAASTTEGVQNSSDQEQSESHDVVLNAPTNDGQLQDLQTPRPEQPPAHAKSSPLESEDPVPELSHTTSTIGTSESGNSDPPEAEEVTIAARLVSTTDTAPPRRSERAKRPRPSYEASPPQDRIVMSEARRNPKRKVQEQAEQARPTKSGEDLLEEALKPMTAQDIEEWEGWHEVESEPVSLDKL